jgi:subtilisin-like proprotein convertase family protein
VNFVAHELGHQFGARHTFNNCAGGPGDDAQIAHEPASGSTIMGYAGLCGSNNLQILSDPMFASVNIDQIREFVVDTALACAVAAPTGNAPPVVDAGPDRVIPARTPFELRPAAAGDPDADALTFSWEQRDGGPPANLPLVDLGTNPLFRVWPPSLDSARTLPRLSNLLAGTLASGETLPTTSRQMRWRLVARDNRAGAGATGFDDLTITTVDTGAPFAITTPSGPASWTGGSGQAIAWNVAGTSSAPINAASVRIVFSADGGQTWPIVLSPSTPNDGLETIVAPVLDTTQGRLRVEAIGNIFFSVNAANLSVVSPPLAATLELAGTPIASDATGNGNANGRVEPGENSIRVLVPIRNVGQTPAADLVATLTSLTPTATVAEGVAWYAYASGFGGEALGATPFVLAISPDHPCGEPISLVVGFTSSTASPAAIPVTLATGAPGGPGPLVRHAYAGVPVAIPDNLQAGGSATITLAQVSGPILDVNFSFDGTICSTSSASTTVGLQHGFMGDLAMTLRSPAGTVLPLSTRRGGWGNNMCNTVFDDAAAVAISSITASGAPWSSTYRPEQPLAGFNGQSANGVWTLRIVDNVAGEAGWIRAFSLWVQTQQPPACEPPVSGCDSVDFNNDGSFFDPQDIDAFLSVYSEGSCVPESATCSDVDFNNDGTSFDPLDIEAFLRVFSQGPC